MRKRFMYLWLMLGLSLYISSCRNTAEDDTPQPKQEEVTPDEEEVTCSDDPIIDNNGLLVSLADNSFSLPQNISLKLKIEEIANSDTVGVADLEIDNFTIFENDKMINPLESEVKITPIPGEFNIYTLLLLDLSGSILNSETSLQNLKEASVEFLNGFIRNSNGNPLAAVYWFDGDSTIHELLDFTSDTLEIENEINAIDSDISRDRSTNLHGGIEQGALLVKDLEGVDENGVVSISQMVVFTDGDDEAAWRSVQDAADAINSTIGQEVSIYTIGLGEIIDRDKLELFGRDGFEFVDNFDALVQSFNRIADRINSNVNSFYFFEYCSPKRNGEHNLKLVIEKSGTQKASITYCFDATGFSDNCNLNE